MRAKSVVYSERGYIAQCDVVQDLCRRCWERWREIFGWNGSKEAREGEWCHGDFALIGIVEDANSLSPNGTTILDVSLFI